MAEEDDIVLSELDDEELVQQMHDDLYDGLKDEVEEGVNILLNGYIAKTGTGTFPCFCFQCINRFC